jgi:hypothetical protein
MLFHFVNKWVVRRIEIAANRLLAKGQFFHN